MATRYDITLPNGTRKKVFYNAAQDKKEIVDGL